MIVIDNLQKYAKYDNHIVMIIIISLLWVVSRAFGNDFF